MQLSSHRHSGRLVPHHHTSYGGLAIVLAATAVVLAIATSASVVTSNASSGMVGVTETVPGAPPAVPPSITTPLTGDRVTTNELTVAGACQAGLLVAVQAGANTLGSVACNDSGGYSLTVSLLAGTTTLVAHQYDGLNQSSPPSNSVSVSYVVPVVAVTVPAVHAPGTAAATPAAVAALRLLAPYHFPYLQPGDSFEFTADLEGGRAPYAVQIDWGDGTQGLLSLVHSGIFTALHRYAQSGGNEITVRATDSAGAATSYQVAVVVNGAVAAQPQTAAPSNQTQLQGYSDILVWSLLPVLALIVGSFWLGERYDRRRYTPVILPLS